MKVCEGSISSRFGNRVHPVTGQRHFHNGVDIATPVGTPVYSPSSGFVTDVSESDIGGKRIVVSDGMGVEYIFLHLSKQLVIQGAPVSKASLIAQVGATGRVTGAHLHFSVKQNGQYIDPTPYIEI